MQFTLKYNPKQNGLRTLFREWQITTMQILWENPKNRYTTYGEGFFAPGCWVRTVEDHYKEKTFIDVPENELWYSSDNTNDTEGYAIISTYKDLNETVGFIVYGYTAEDTYSASYALRGGLLPWLQQLQNGTTTLILEIDYNDIHPVNLHIAECLGPFTECTGFNTNFKTSDYTANYNDAHNAVV